MKSNRRTFLRNTSLVAFGGMLRPQSLFAQSASTTTTLAAGLPLSATDRAIMDFVASYSTGARIIGSCVFGKLRASTNRATHILAQVEDPAKFQAQLGRASFSGAFAQGNVLSFISGDTTFTIENLVPASFAARVADLALAEKVAFAHDGLVYNPARRQLSDPFRAVAANSLTLTKLNFSTAAGLEVVLRGSSEAVAIGISESATFKSLKAAILARTGTTGEVIPIVGALVRELAAFSHFAGLAQTKAILRSKVVATALAQLCALNVESAIARFDQLRPDCGGAYSDATVWVYVLFRTQLATTVLDQFMTERLHPASLIEDLRSHEMLTEARSLLRALDAIQSAAD